MSNKVTLYWGPEHTWNAICFPLLPNCILLRQNTKNNNNNNGNLYKEQKKKKNSKKAIFIVVLRYLSLTHLEKQNVSLFIPGPVCLFLGVFAFQFSIIFNEACLRDPWVYRTLKTSLLAKQVFFTILHFKGRLLKRHGAVWFSLGTMV